MSVWWEREDSDGSDGSPIPLCRNGKAHQIRSSSTLNRQRAIRNLSDTSSDMSGLVSENERTHSDSSWEATRNGIRPIGPSRQASVSGGRSAKTVGTKETASRASEGIVGGDGDGRKPVQPTLGRSSPMVDIVANSSGEETKSNATTVAGGGGRPSRSHRRGVSKDPSARSGVNTHSSHSTTRRTRHISSSNRSRDRAAEDMSQSSLEDVRSLSCSANGSDSEYCVCRCCLPDAGEFGDKRKGVECDASMKLCALSRANSVGNRAECFSRRI